LTYDPLRALFEEDRDFTLERLAEAIREEVDALEEDLNGALARQWERSPVPTPRFDTSQRSQGDHSDPTADTVADERRLGIRDVVKRCEARLQETLVDVRSVRVALSRAVDRYDGER